MALFTPPNNTVRGPTAVAAVRPARRPTVRLATPSPLAEEAEPSDVPVVPYVPTAVPVAADRVAYDAATATPRPVTKVCVRPPKVLKAARAGPL